MIPSDKIAEITKRYREGEPSKSIAADYHVTPAAVAYHLRKAGVLRRGSPNPRVEKTLRERGGEIVQRYKRGESMAALALAYHLSTFTIRRWLIQNDVRIRPSRQGQAEARKPVARSSRSAAQRGPRVR